MNPGKLDLLHRSRPGVEEYNLFWWSPLVKAGAGTIDPDDSDPVEYAGGYARPLLPIEGAGELIVGGLVLDAAGTSSHELQAEYRSPSGIGLGGGYVERPGEATDVSFGKLSLRKEIDGTSFILTALAQETGDETEPGGYFALHDGEVLGAFGHDGEQWRLTLNYIFPESDGRLRPAFEGLYVDNAVGALDGPRTLFLNGTLGFRGGFLSHPAALGRAMGPQGLEYGNPLGFLNPTWNRRLDTWELGRVLDWRVIHTEAPNGSSVSDYELVLYPFQLDDDAGVIDSFLVGAFHADAPGRHTPGALLGFSGRAGFLQLSIVLRHEFDTGDSSAVLGLIDPF